MTKSPEMEALFARLKAEKNAIQEKTLPLRSKRDALLASIQSVLDQVAKLEKEYLDIERPRLPELDNQISDLARVLGSRRMSEPEKVKAK